MVLAYMFIKFCSPALNFDSLAKAMVAKRRITTRVEVLIVDFNLLFNNYRNWEKICVMNQLLPFFHAFFIIK